MTGWVNDGKGAGPAEKMELSREEVAGRFMTSPEMIDGTGVTYRQLDYWRRRGFIRATHGMFSSVDSKKPVRVWVLTGGEGETFSGAKVLWERAHQQTLHDCWLIELVSVGVDLGLAVRLARATRYGVTTEEDRQLFNALATAVNSIVFKSIEGVQS